MIDLTTKDNEVSRLRNDHVPEAMGQAAVLLIESLIHGLIERKVITVADALEDLEVAIDVLAENEGAYGKDKAVTERSQTILGDMHRSLWADLAA